MNELPVLDVFESEADIAENARLVEQSGYVSVEDYRRLREHYERLLRQVNKIVRLGDANTSKLVKAREKLERANERLRRVQERRKDLLGLVVHDLKNRLFPLLSLSEFLVANCSDQSDPDLVDMLRIIKNSSEEMHQTVIQILDKERSREDELTMVAEQCDLADLLEKNIDRNRAHAAGKNIALQTEHVEPCQAQVDEYLLGDALNNLINNALKFSPSGTTVRVRLHREQHLIGQAPASCLFTIRDEGPGLTAADKQNLFERFHTCSAKPTGGEKSTGLGLALVKKVVELHGGEIWAESAGPGQGSTFFVRIPCA